MTPSQPAAEILQKLAEADLYRTQGLLNEARAVLMELLQTIPASEEELRHQAIVALESMPALPPSVATAPDASAPDQSRQQQYENCLALMSTGFFPEAIEQLHVLLKAGFNSALVHGKMGECCLNLNKPFEALEHLEEAVADETIPREDRLDFLDRLALTQEATGAIPQAIKALEKIIQIDRTFRNVKHRLTALSQTAQKSGRFYGLVQQKLLTMEDLERARTLAKQQNKTIDGILLSNFDIEKKRLGESLSSFYNCPYVEFDAKEVGTTPGCIKEIKEHFLRVNNFVPIAEEGDGTLLVATDNPHDLVKTDNIKAVLKTGKINFRVALQEDIDRFIDYFYGKYSLADEEGAGRDVFDQLDLQVVADEEERGDEVQSHADGVVVQMANKIIEDAINASASDIHIESLMGTRGVQIRFRVDGECQHYRHIPYNYKRSLVSRLKILSQLDISERRLPQDGKIKFKTRNGKSIELRVATLPTTGNNEDMVLRILSSSSAMPLDKAGLSEHNLSRFKEVIEKPYGLIAVCGPTGSGKTTTLHAALRHINRPEKKIWTVEDPVEIVQDGLRQVQVQNKIDLTFARVLKAFLRADPDVIMVGETRDHETAATVIEASLTGHLVFTTLHTNSAPETITRLIGMGMDPFTFADSLLAILAQRLVKRLCLKCRAAALHDPTERRAILEAYGAHPLQPLPATALDTATLFSPVGCASCQKTGYRGRFGLHELLVSNDSLKLKIAQNLPVTALREAAMENGMLTLMQDGILKALHGDTSFHAVRAACIK